MAKKPSKYSKMKSVKAIARERVGSPPPARKVAEKSDRQKIKHKKNLSQGT